LRDIRREQYASGLMVDFSEDQDSEPTGSDDELISIKETKTIGQFKKDPSFAEKVRPYRYGTGGARVVSMELLDAQGQEKDSFGFREALKFIRILMLLTAAYYLETRMV